MCNDNLNRQLQSYNKDFDKIENCLADMSVTVELGISLPNSLGKDDTQCKSYLDSLKKYSGYIAKGEEEFWATSDHVEQLQMKPLRCCRQGKRRRRRLGR